MLLSKPHKRPLILRVGDHKKTLVNPLPSEKELRIRKHKVKVEEFLLAEKL